MYKILKTIGLILLFVSFSFAQSKNQIISYLNYENAKPIIDEFGSDLPSELISANQANKVKDWDNWVRESDKKIRERLEQGDEDSIVNLLLFGTSFTKQPRLTEEQITQLSNESAKKSSEVFETILDARLNDFILALTKLQNNERLLFAKSHLVKKLKVNLLSNEGKIQVKTFLIDSLKRVLNESAGFVSLIEQTRQNQGDTFIVRSQLFKNRGLSSDTTLKPNFAIENALTQLKAKGIISKINKVAIIGPGLDYTDKDEGYDFYPPQTIQPFAVIESLIKLGLTDINSLKIDTYDLSPKVNSHIQTFASKAKKKENYAILLPFDLEKNFTTEFTNYWQNFGKEIALPSASKYKETNLQLDVRSVKVRSDILSKINAFDTNIVLQHPNLVEKERYDLVIGTNIFLYYSSFEQALAMRNLNEMLKDNGILLSNNALIEFPFTPIHSIGYSKAIYSKKQGDADAIVWYQKK
jgi:hypothetical protein